MVPRRHLVATTGEENGITNRSTEAAAAAAATELGVRIDGHFVAEG